MRYWKESETSQRPSTRTSIWDRLQAASTLLVGGLFALAIVGCGPRDTSDGGGCEADDECKGDRICEDGECVDPGEGGNGDGDTGTEGDSSSSQNGDSTICCVQGMAYQCSVSSCRQVSSMSDCSRASSKDGQCSNNNNQDTGGGDKGSMGDVCQTQSDCKNACVHDCVEPCDGICSKQCDHGTDCPLGWSCKDVDDMSGKYCVQDN